MERYQHPEIEAKWQAFWREQATFVAQDGVGSKSYVLDMFPYPSGAGLHVGHPEGYTATDIYCRYLRMKGVNVLHPMGWDAFGLPAENYAIKTGRRPRDVTWENIANFKRQIQSLGLSYDWTRELNTADPSYYKWTQWLFLKLYEKGLAYRKAASVNWCPGCQTVLANEQVVDGACERCSSQVEQRQMEQWFFKITAYAEELLKDLDRLDWPVSILDMQRNWIGKSEGAEVKFLISDSKFLIKEIKIFTTRLDTIYGTTFVVVSPELIQEWVDIGFAASKDVKEYVKIALKGKELERIARAEKDKTGVDTGMKALNPATGEEIPVWVADYVLGGYGTGAIMAVPAHDERDFAFAKKFGLPIKRVVEPKFTAVTGDAVLHPEEEVVKRNAVCCVVRNPKDDTYLCVSWKDFVMHGFVTGGLEAGEDIVKAALREIHEETGYKNVRLVRDPQFALHSFFYHRVKKQNRWARFQYLFFELENEECDPIAAKEQALHEIVWKQKNELKDFFSVIEGEFMLNFLANPDYIHTGEGMLWNSGEFSGLESGEAKAPIAKKIGAELKTQYRIRDWLISRQRYWGAPIPIIYCAQCGAAPVPENDLPVLLPDDVDFKPTGESPLVGSKSFHDVKCPKCGKPARRESDTMDTFVDSAWYFLRFTDAQNSKEAFSQEAVAKWLPVDVYVGGAEHAVKHLLYARFITKVLRDCGYVSFGEPFTKLRNQGLIMGEDGQKMSKSRGNVINPDDIVKEYGADTLRMYEMFMGPLEDAKPWNTKSIIGIKRFLEKVWRLCASESRITNQGSSHVAATLARITKRVTEDIPAFRFNTAIAGLMELTNELQGAELTTPAREVALRTLLTLLYPFAPHITSELWEQLKFGNNIWEQSWPSYDEEVLKQETMTIAVQVNGKLRGTVQAAPGAVESEVLALAKENLQVAKNLEGKQILKTIFVPGKLLSFVVR